MSVLDHPLARPLREQQPVLWINPSHDDPVVDDPAIDVEAAEDRMRRAEPLLRGLFPACAAAVKPIRSDLVSAPEIAAALRFDEERDGAWFVKADHQLPVAGSVKARGGFHEVLAFAERLAQDQGLMAAGGDLSALSTPAARDLFAQHAIVVGSTGNLGMSIGLMSAALGFRAVVHMSHDAKAWKKRRLRDHGAVVIEHEGDYAAAVAKGRAEAEADPRAHFVDDEYSVDLFVGYAVAARELAAQLAERGRAVDADHPLFVYIPCGVGGAPGGIAYGLKRIFGPHVHCLFAEPVAAPCLLVQMIAGDEPTPVSALGLDNRTEADGLAVGQASLLVAPLMRQRLAGSYTLNDEQMFALLETVRAAQGIRVEPSAAAGFAGPAILTRSAAGRRYLAARGLAMAGATHVVWTTGGSLVPADEYAGFTARGRAARVDLDFDWS